MKCVYLIEYYKLDLSNWLDLLTFTIMKNELNIGLHEGLYKLYRIENNRQNLHKHDKKKEWRKMGEEIKKENKGKRI